MTETSQIAKNVEAREDAESAWQLVVEIAEQSADEQRFWECFCELYDDRFPVEIPPGTVQPMTDEESRNFEKTSMKFGQHNGSRIRNIPLAYLLWLDDQEDFRHDLKRYLANERIQNEQD